MYALNGEENKDEDTMKITKIVFIQHCIRVDCLDDLLST